MVNVEQVELKPLKPNNDIHEIIEIIDLITDEYGNYYYPVKVHTSKETGKLLSVLLSNALYEDSFQEVLYSQTPKEYENQYIGVMVRDRLLANIERLKKNNRTIFTLNDLKATGASLSTWKITEPHPKENQ